MIVGGNDVVIEAHPGMPVAEVVLDSVRRYWPQAQFQDADSDNVHAIDDAWVRDHGPRSREFFLYRDAEAVQSWHRDGGTAANLSRMLYFIIGAPPAEPNRPRALTLVCGRKTKKLQGLIDDLTKALHSPGARPPQRARNEAVR